MEINLNTWHGWIVKQLITRASWRTPRTLCEHWRYVFSGFLFAVFAIYVFVSIVSVPLWALHGNGFGDDAFDSASLWIVLLVHVGAAIWIIGFITGALFVVGYVLDVLAKFKRSQISQNNSQSSLIAESYRAFKEKYCPLITYKEDTE